jgi:hypothetical protein
MSSERSHAESGVQSPPTESVRVVRIAAISFTAILALANLATVAVFGPHLRAAGPAIILVNLGLIVLGMACVPTVQRISAGAPLDCYAIAVVGGPFLAWGLDVVIIQWRTFGF